MAVALNFHLCLFKHLLKLYPLIAPHPTPRVVPLLLTKSAFADPWFTSIYPLLFTLLYFQVWTDTILGIYVKPEPAAVRVEAAGERKLLRCDSFLMAFFRAISCAKENRDLQGVL